MWLHLILWLLIVLQANSLSVLTDKKSPTTELDGENGDALCKSEVTKSDILKQLLNQETLIRMSLEKKVHNLVTDMDGMNKGMAEMKAGIEKNNKQFQKEIVVLRNELLSLKNENAKLKTDVLKYQDITDSKFKVTEENFTQITENQEQYERKLTEDFETLEKNTTSNVDSINGIKTTMNSIKADVAQSQKAQLELSSAVSSLEFLLQNMTSSGKRIHLWASEVIRFSSEFTKKSWSANQILGKPDVYPRYGDSVNAWAPEHPNKDQFIEIKFPRKLFISEINIFETYNAGGVVKISARDPQNQWIDVFNATHAQHIRKSRKFSPEIQEVRFPVSELRIEVDCSVSRNYVEIDAVEIVGEAMDNH